MIDLKCTLNQIATTNTDLSLIVHFSDDKLLRFDFCADKYQYKDTCVSQNHTDHKKELERGSPNYSHSLTHTVCNVLK